MIICLDEDLFLFIALDAWKVILTEHLYISPVLGNFLFLLFNNFLFSGFLCKFRNLD